MEEEGVDWWEEVMGLEERVEDKGAELRRKSAVQHDVAIVCCGFAVAHIVAVPKTVVSVYGDGDL